MLPSANPLCRCVRPSSDKEFKTIWLRVADVRGELLKRGVQVSKWANPWKLMKLLDKKLEEEVEKVCV